MITATLAKPDQTSEGVMVDYRLISWNIDSLNAALTSQSERGKLSLAVLESIAAIDPDIIALQETKLSAEPGRHDSLFEQLAGLFPDHDLDYRVAVPPARKGYAGTLLLHRRSLGQPLIEAPSIGAPEPMDDEGRVLALEYADFFVVTVYTPNAGDGLSRLALRGEWDDRFREYLGGLDQAKPVLVGGDFNVAHTEQDLANPATNHQSPGFTDQERSKFTELLAAGFTDAFRQLHPDAAGMMADGRSAYTWFSQRIRTAKANNAGWRIDYWLVSDRVAGGLRRCEPLDSGLRQDHSPLLLEWQG